MKLSLRAFSITAGIIWCGAVFLVGLANHAWPTYGGSFLEMVASIYPGYQHVEQIGSVFVGAGYALVDGLVGGLIFAWLYNLIVSAVNVSDKQPAAQA